MTTSTDKRPGAGDRVPGCTGITAQGHLYASEEQTGRPVVAIVARTLAVPGLVPLLEAFSPLAGPLNGRGIDLVALIGEDVEAVFEFNVRHPGGVTLVRSDLFRTLRGFDPLIPVLGEDLDRPYGRSAAPL